MAQEGLTFEMHKQLPMFSYKTAQILYTHYINKPRSICIFARPFKQFDIKLSMSLMYASRLVLHDYSTEIMTLTTSAAFSLSNSKEFRNVAQLETKRPLFYNPNLIQVCLQSFKYRTVRVHTDVSIRLSLHGWI